MPASVSPSRPATTKTGQPISSHPASRPRDVPRSLWLWFPIASIAIIFGVRGLGTDVYDRVMGTELGVVEIGTVILLGIAIVAGTLAYRRSLSLHSPWLSRWVLIVTLGCIYIAIEELSWGQHLFGWQTPAGLDAINRHGETNLHNISSWFDQKPRLVVEMAIIFGGVVFPLWALSRGFAPDPRRDWRYWFWPTFACFPAAAIVAAARLPKRFEKWFGWPKPPPLDIQLSEVQEYFFAAVFMIYLSSLYVRLRRLDERERSEGPAPAKPD